MVQGGGFSRQKKETLPTSLQTDPESTFVRFAVVSRRNERGYEALRNTTHLEITDGETIKRHITDGDDYRNTLTRCLGVDLGPEVETLWRIVSERVSAHQEARGEREQRSVNEDH